MSQLSYHKVERHDNMPFDQYLALPGLSHSSIKSGGSIVQETEAMRLGKLVDGILTEPGSVTMGDPLYPQAKLIAAEIRHSFGSMMEILASQVSFTGEIRRQVEGGYFSMLTKGRLDFLLEGLAVVDLKVTKSKDIRQTMPIFRYDNQLFNYAGLAGVAKGYISAYSIPRKSTDTIIMDLSTGEEFWLNAVVKYGTFVREAA